MPETNNKSGDMTDSDINVERVAGEIRMVMEDGSEEEKASLLRVIEKLCGKEESERIALLNNL